MEVEVRIKVPEGVGADGEAAARQVLLLVAAKIIEAVTRENGNNRERR